MSDEKFEEFLQREAKAAYNAPPPATPADEMWSAIGRVRAERRSAAVAPRRMRYAPWIGMAATLLLGVGIGRYALQRDAAEPTSGAPRVVVAPDPDIAGGRTAESTSGSAPISPTPAQRAAAAGMAPGSDNPVPPRSLAAQRAVAASEGTNRATTGGATSVSTNGTARGDANATPYRVASERHLASAEALISVVTTAPRDAMLDSLTSRWAREMLGNTRLLLDSPAGADPVRRRLLEDLETLLVQLVQRSGTPVDERDLIDRTLQRTQLLTRLRSNAAGT
ncbi:MAG: hypothetical protein ACYC0B_04665 [Gemmatimonadaceae bacterium]